MKLFAKHIIAVSSLALTVTACAFHPEVMRHEVAERLASPAWMIEREIPADPFSLTAFERMHEKSAPANIYIGGDGEAVIPVIDDHDTGYKHNATPKNPVALHLASKDKADNLAYIARPCQYTAMIDGSECDNSVWEYGQYSPTVIASMNTALDSIKRRYNITAYNLIGYSGGATLAALLAAERSDVLSLRTVSGKFDMNTLTPALPKLRNMPQHHFVGEHDEIVGTAQLQTYMNALGDSRCADNTIIHEATHDKGFVNPWPELLKDKAPRCKTPQALPFEPMDMPKTVFVPRMGGDKK